MSGYEQHGKLECTDFEILLSDYLDEALSGEQKRLFEAHAADCSPCREMMEDARGAVEFIERVAEVEVPPDLVTRIVYHAPKGRLRHPSERRTPFGRVFTDWFVPLLQPRFAMGMAMTILSFAMLGRCTGVHVTEIKAAELNPVKIWQNMEDRAIRTKDRAVKSYENLRVVYEIRSRINELEEKRDQAESQMEQSSNSNIQQNQAPADQQQPTSGQLAPSGQKTGGNKQ